MAKIELPTQKRKAESYNPKLLIFMGKFKSGKSTAIASLEDTLVIDLEDGYRALEAMVVEAHTAYDLFYIKNALDEQMKSTGKKPYRRIAIDNATRLEEMAIIYATALYRKTAQGKTYGMIKDDKGLPVLDANGKPQYDPNVDVRTLAQGAGYLYMRKAVQELIDMFTPYCETLILVTHSKSSQINDNGVDLEQFSPDLAGKTGNIMCGLADAVGMIYRKGNQTILSFKSSPNSINEARPLHLRGKEFVVIESDENNNIKVDLEQIFVNNRL